MRDTGDMMDDALSEDTMMDCGGDEALYDLIDLSNEMSHSAPTIKDAAERLLTLLGMEEGDDDDDGDDVLSSSEDEGVELDEGSDEDEDEPESTRLLHQLAVSLAQELKYSQKQLSAVTPRQCGFQRVAKTSHETPRNQQTDEQMQCMEVAQEVSYQETEKSGKFGSSSSHVPQTLERKSSSGRGFFGPSEFDFNPTSLSPKEFRSDTRFRTNHHDDLTDGRNATINAESSGSGSGWTAGWDACAAEAVRFLVEDEGLSPHHPTVLAMKSHLDAQRERTLAQFTV